MSGFIDPTPNKPVDAIKFLSFLDLSPVSAALDEFYCESWRSRHPPEAMIRLLALYKLKRYRFLTELWRQLNDEAVKLLGFKWKPSYKTVWHWLNKRMGPEGIEAVHAALIEAINQALTAQGIRMGERVAGDATPVHAKRTDKEAAYNGYYKKRCYLVHRLVSYETNLTLEWLVTPGNVDEGQLMMPLLAKTVFDGVRPKEAVFDNGYASYWNYEIPNLLGIKLLIGFRKRAMMGWRGKPKTLKLRYRKMVKAGKLSAEKLKELGLQSDPDKNCLEDILSALAIAGQHEYVGAYYRNQSLTEFRRDRLGWLGRYVPLRSIVEGCHGHQKDWLDLDNLKVKGLHRARLHTALCMLSEAAVAYDRVQHGVVKALTSQAFIR
jgi:hypothetical protein